MATTYTDVIQTSDIPDALRVIYSNELEMTARPKLIYEQFVEVKNDFRAKKGEKVVWTIYRQLPPAIGPLLENVDVDGGKMTDFQVDLTIDEYGYAMGTTERLNLTSYHGPISNIVRTMLAPQMALTQDILARNAFLGPRAKYKNYAGGASARSGITVEDGTITDNIIRRAAHALSIRRVPLLNGSYVAVINPSVSFDIRGLSYWKDAQLYAGSTAIFNGEIGMLHGVRFIESDTARLPNAGAVIHETTLDGAVKVGDSYIIVDDASGFEVGQEITIYSALKDTPDGTDPTQEDVVIDDIDLEDNKLILRTKLLFDHANGSKVREGVDIYPIVFLGGLPAVGKGVVVEPEVRVALPTDRLRRMHFVGWYALMGYDVIRDWAYDLWEVAATQASAPAHPW